MKRDWSKFQPKVIVTSPEKTIKVNLGRSCCGGSCIGGNCKAIPNASNFFE